MDAKHLGKPDPRPKRRKDRDNPYTIFTEKRFVKVRFTNKIFPQPSIDLLLCFPCQRILNMLKMKAVLRCWKSSLDILPNATHKALLRFSTGLLPLVRRF